MKSAQNFSGTCGIAFFMFAIICPITCVPSSPEPVILSSLRMSFCFCVSDGREVDCARAAPPSTQRTPIVANTVRIRSPWSVLDVYASGVVAFRRRRARPRAFRRCEPRTSRSCAGPGATLMRSSFGQVRPLSAPSTKMRSSPCDLQRTLSPADPAIAAGSFAGSSGRSSRPPGATTTVCCAIFCPSPSTTNECRPGATVNLRRRSAARLAVDEDGRSVGRAGHRKRPLRSPRCSRRLRPRRCARSLRPRRRARRLRPRRCARRQHDWGRRHARRCRRRRWRLLRNVLRDGRRQIVRRLGDAREILGARRIERRRNRRRLRRAAAARRRHARRRTAQTGIDGEPADGSQQADAAEHGCGSAASCWRKRDAGHGRLRRLDGRRLFRRRFGKQRLWRRRLAPRAAAAPTKPPMRRCRCRSQVRELPRSASPGPRPQQRTPTLAPAVRRPRAARRPRAERDSFPRPPRRRWASLFPSVARAARPARSVRVSDRPARSRPACCERGSAKAKRRPAAAVSAAPRCGARASAVASAAVWSPSPAKSCLRRRAAT